MRKTTRTSQRTMRVRRNDDDNNEDNEVDELIASGHIKLKVSVKQVTNRRQVGNCHTSR